MATPKGRTEDFASEQRRKAAEAADYERRFRSALSDVLGGHSITKAAEVRKVSATKLAAAAAAARSRTGGADVMLLRLKCLRCGDPADMDPCELLHWGLCQRCTTLEVRVMLEVTATGKMGVLARWLRFFNNRERHPTFKALNDAMAKMEAVPHGTLEVGDV